MGEQVWLYNPAVKQGVSKKLSCLWRGPYTVIDRVGDVNYRIQLIGSTQTLLVHRNRLKLCYGTPSQQQSRRTQQETPTVLGTDEQVGHIAGVGDKLTLKPTYANVTKLQVGGYTSSHNVGIHSGMPARQLLVQQADTNAPPLVEVPADNLGGVVIEVQPADGDQAETLDGELPSNEEVHPATVSADPTATVESNDSRLRELRPRHTLKPPQRFTS